MFLEAFLLWIPVGVGKREDSGEKEVAAVSDLTGAEAVPTSAPQNQPSSSQSVKSPTSSDPVNGSPSEQPPVTEATDFTDVSKIAIVLNFLLDNQSREWVALHQDMMNMWNELVTINKLTARDYLDLLWRMYTAREIEVQRLVKVVAECSSRNIFTLELVEGKLKGWVERETIDESIDLLTAFCQSEIYNGKEEELLQTLDSIFENADNQGMIQYLELLHKLVLKKKVSATNYMSLVGLTFQKRKISMAKYAEITGRCMHDNIMTFDFVMNELKNFVDKRYCSRNEVTDSMVGYYMNNQVNEETLVEEVCSHPDNSSNKYMFPYFLQSLYLRLSVEDSTKLKVEHLFKSIRESFLVDLTNAFVQCILISHELSLIDGDTGVEIIQNTTKITVAEFEGMIKYYVPKDVLSTEKITQLLALALHKKMIKDEFYVETLLSLRKDSGKLEFGEYIDLLKSGLLERLITERCFEKQVFTHIQLKEGDKKEWIALVAQLAKTKSIGDSLRVKLFELIFKNFKLSSGDVDRVLTKLGMSKEDKDTVLRDVKFPLLPKILQTGKGKKDEKIEQKPSETDTPDDER